MLILISQNVSKPTIMKHFATFLLIIITNLGIKAQDLTVSTPTFSFGNLEKNASFSVAIPGGDLGTNRYMNWVPSVAVTIGVYRENGFWRILSGQTSSSSYSYYRYPVLSSSIDPPCVGVWEQVSTTAAVYTVIDTVTITCVPSNVGACFTSPNVAAANITPTGVSFPQYNSADILTLTGVSPGTMVWSIDEACLKVYNGSTWNCL